MRPTGGLRRFWAAGLGMTLLLAAAATPAAQAPPEEWRTFQGHLSALGQRQTLPTEGVGLAASVRLSGTLTLISPAGLARGFRANMIGFDDGQGVSTGRAVWTDATGDLVFSVLKGEALETGRQIVGTITGGTGRYTGATGDYNLTWQYFVIQQGENLVQGRAIDVRGRVRLSETGRR